MRPDIVHTHPYIDQWRAKGYQYYVVPKAMLRSGKQFGLGMDEVMLYAILRDRVSLSFENGWLDERGRIYIIFTRGEASRLLAWSPRKTVDVFARLVESGLLTEVEQKGAGVLRKPKRLYVRQWAEPSPLHTVDELRGGGFNYLTEQTVYASPGDYYVLPQCLLTDPIYEGLGLRPVLVYMLALDQLHLSIQYGRVDGNGLVWCCLDNETVRDDLGCSRNSLYQAYKDLESIGLMTRVRNGGNSKVQYRIYLRDYLPPPVGAAAPGEETVTPQNLHMGVPKSACGEAGICTWEAQNLHMEPPNPASAGCQNPRANQPSYPSPSISSTSLTSIAAGAADATGCRENVNKLAGTLSAIRRQVNDRELREDIRRFMDSAHRGAALDLLDKSLSIMAEDALHPAPGIRLGDEVLDKADVLQAYRGLDQYILYTMLDKVAARASGIRNMELYLHRALVQAVANHSGEAHYVKMELNARRASAEGELESAWPW